FKKRSTSIASIRSYALTEQAYFFCCHCVLHVWNALVPALLHLSYNGPCEQVNTYKDSSARVILKLRYISKSIFSAALGQYFNKRNLLITFAVIFIFCCLEGACLYYSNIPYEDLSERLNKTSKIMQHFDQQYKVPEQAIPHLTDGAQTTPATHHNISGVIPVAEDFKRYLALTGDDYTRNPLILYFYGIAVVSHALSYLIIIISAHFMMNTLREKQVILLISSE
ncbi:unnamed protein product, partial [Strongylus vulgaris]